MSNDLSKTASTGTQEMEYALTGSVDSTKVQAEKKLKVTSLTEDLRAVFDDWVEKLGQDPKSYACGIDGFVKNARELNAVSDMNSATYTFGEFSRRALVLETKKSVMECLFGSKRTEVQLSDVNLKMVDAIGRLID